MKSKIKQHAALWFLLTVLGATAAQAGADNGGVMLSGTRLIYDGNKNVAGITVTNSAANDVWLMRFWISPYGDKDQGKNNKPPFVVTPPLYRLDPDATVQLRINRMKDSLPPDRESVFYLNNLAIPPKKGEKNFQKSVQGGLQFAVNTRIKMFYRPAAVSNVPAVKEAPNKLSVAVKGKAMSIKNPTPYFITLSQIAINGAPVRTDQDTMVPPFGDIRLPAKVPHGTLSYSTIDDRGMTTPVLKKTF
ncbi:fimbrial biogenesis chaperone [Serratia ficaria]|uniref:fimbrial biogenesis chaperone n=1 Tax=Serratia ficaria TaxID=61651 RepID=UPI002179E51D|nr:molecular chaperone [Serratia ficaria]CAI1507670.1 Chaperone protein fimC precursor [Serratia ficaria]